MIAWCIVAALYTIGFIGLHAMGQDINGGPIREKRTWINLFLWPVTILWAKVMDVFDYIRGD